MNSETSSSCSQYCDFSSVPDIEIPCKTKGGVTMPFPVKLHHLLEHIDLNEPEFANIISWQPHGRCFLTHDAKMIEQKNVLSKCFQHKNYASFRRQLNLWGFKRITKKGPDQGAYYHELFLRSKPYLCRAINRLQQKIEPSRRLAAAQRNWLQPANNSEVEPIFSSMPVLPPSSSSRTSPSKHDEGRSRIGNYSLRGIEELRNNNYITSTTPFDESSSLFSSSTEPAPDLNRDDPADYESFLFSFFEDESKCNVKVREISTYDDRYMPCASRTVLHRQGALLADFSITDFQQQCEDLVYEEEVRTRHSCDVSKYENLTPYPLRNPPPATDQEMIDIMNFLKKLK